MLTSISTVFLLCLIVAYHALELQLFLIDNNAEDWRIALTGRRMCQLSVELLVCAICPIPGDFTFVWATIHADGETYSETQVPLDVLLSIPMFLRVYLICRVLLLHSKLFTDASSRSIGALNRINFNTKFVLKNLMTVSPGTVLCVVTLSFWVLSAWILRLCERHHTISDRGSIIVEAQKHENYLNSLWLIAITFLSVGYGDIVPNTYCGRAVAVLTGILGAGASSLVVAVIARKLELSRAEKHVHNFMQDNLLTKRLKQAAANVLRETWLIYKYRKLTFKPDPNKIRKHQRKFLVAIYEMRKVKRDQRKLAENLLSVADIAKTATSTHEIVSDIHRNEYSLESRISALESEVQEVQTLLIDLPKMVVAQLRNQLPDQHDAYKHGHHPQHQPQQQQQQQQHPESYNIQQPEQLMPRGTSCDPNSPSNNTFAAGGSSDATPPGRLRSPINHPSDPSLRTESVDDQL